MKTYEPNIDNKTKRFVKKYNDGYGARNSTLTVSISEDLKKEVKRLAQENNESLSNMVNIILADHLKGGTNQDDLYSQIANGEFFANTPFKVFKYGERKAIKTYQANQHISKKYIEDKKKYFIGR